METFVFCTRFDSKTLILLLYNFFFSNETCVQQSLHIYQVEISTSDFPCEMIANDEYSKWVIWLLCNLNARQYLLLTQKRENDVTNNLFLSMRHASGCFKVKS